MMRRACSLLLVALLAALTAGCGVLGGGDSSYEVTAQLARSYNLFPGSPVRVLGVDVGTISDISIEPGEDSVEVSLRINGETDLPADANATVVPESLLGERYVQLTAYEGGPRMEEDTTIPLEDTSVPSEFDEVLEALNDFVGGLDGTEVGRLVENLASNLEGQGGQLGRTIDDAHEAIGVLQDNDQELIDLASRLSDLNETLATRDEQLGEVIEDFNTVSTSLVDDRGDIDASLRGLVELTTELDGLLRTNRGRIEQDVETLTRVGRTARRNLDQVSLAILGSAELFRHSERIVERGTNFLPLQDQVFALLPELTDSLVNRLQGICLGAGLDEGTCSLDLLDGLLGGLVCAPPFVPCPEDGSATPLDQGLANIIEAEPELGDALLGVLSDNAEDAERERDEQQGSGSDGDPDDGGGDASGDEGSDGDDGGDEDTDDANDGSSDEAEDDADADDDADAEAEADDEDGGGLFGGLLGMVRSP